MIKIKTLYKKDLNDLSKVTEEIDEENLWVFDEGVEATRKFDGTACAVINGELYKRYDAKKNKLPPKGAIPCCEKDEITGHHPHWVKCERTDKSNKYHFEAFDLKTDWVDGTYELIGEKIQGNPEKVSNGHILVRHGQFKFYNKDWLLESIDNLKEFLSSEDIEGIVFHHPDGRMCKIRKVDFGFKR